MMQFVPALLALAVLAVLVLAALRLLRQQELEQELAQAQWEARYYRGETELTLTVTRAMTNTAANRLMSVFGRDYMDYLIARQMNLPAAETEAEPYFEPTISYAHNREPRSYNITGDSVKEWNEQRAREKAYLQTQYEQSGYTPPRPPTMPPRNQTRAARFERPYTPPQQWQPQPQCPVPPCRNLPYWADDDDVLDVQPVIYPPALLPEHASVHAPTGRPRKYASNAERQRAYRERKKARNR